MTVGASDGWTAGEELADATCKDLSLISDASVLSAPLLETPPPHLAESVERFGVVPSTLREAGEAAAAEALQGPVPTGLPRPAVCITRSVHVEASQTDEECERPRASLQLLLAGNPLFEQFAHQCDDCLLRRFLTARSNDPEKACRLLLGALEWRRQHLPVTPDFSELEQQARGGKLRVTGLDKHGRSVVVFDGRVQSSAEPAAQLRFLAFNLEHATRRMEGTPVEKYVIFMHLAGIKFSHCPTRTFLRDACSMMSSCFPERCGNIVFHQAPRIFSSIYKLCSSFVDPRTAAKFVFVVGDDSPGSANDATLREVLGARWRSLSGVGQPRESLDSSPGYVHERDWGSMLSYEYAWALHANKVRNGRTCASIASTACSQDFSKNSEFDGQSEDSAAKDDTTPECSSAGALVMAPAALEVPLPPLALRLKPVKASPDSTCAVATAVGENEVDALSRAPTAPAEAIAEAVAAAQAAASAAHAAASAAAQAATAATAASHAAAVAASAALGMAPKAVPPQDLARPFSLRRCFSSIVTQASTGLSAVLIWGFRGKSHSQFRSMSPWAAVQMMVAGYAAAVQAVMGGKNDSQC